MGGKHHINLIKLGLFFRTGVSYKSLLKRDRYRWSVADQDLDDNLTKDEFTAFLHPEDHPSMKGVVLRETITEEDVGRVWKQHNPDNNETISWDSYMQTVYGFMDDLSPDEKEQEENGM